MPDVGVPELIIVAFLVVLLFGPGRAADLGSALGRSVREFRRESAREEGQPLPAAASPRFCTGCGEAVEPGARFCSACGAPLAVPA